MASKHRLGRWWKSLTPKEKDVVGATALLYAPMAVGAGGILTTLSGHPEIGMPMIAGGVGVPASYITGTIGAALSPTKAEINEFAHHMRMAGHKLRKVV